MPEGPAVAARRALQPGTDLVDRPRRLPLAIEAAVDTHLRLPAALRIGQQRSRRDHAAFDERAERYARRGLRRHHRLHRAFVERQRHLDALLGGGDIVILALDADIMAAEPLRARARRAGAEEAIGRASCRESVVRNV